MLFENVCIESLGYTLPESIVTSSEIEERLGPVYERLKLPEGRLELMTGIGERRFWPAGTLVGDVSVSSCQSALEAAELDRREIGLLVHGSVCRDHLEPATACRVHHLLELPSKCMIYDVSNACLGIMNGMLQAANMIELGQIRAALVVGSENGRGLVDTTIDSLNRNLSLTRKSIKNSIASLTIGSASCAVLLTHRSISKTGNRLTHATATANTRFNDLCQSLGDQAGSLQPLMETDSETLMHQGIETGRVTFERFLEITGWTRDDIHHTFCHQVGGTHRKLMLESVSMGLEKDFTTFPFLGNTGSAALPITLAHAVQADRIASKDRMALLGIGSGINCLVLGVEWHIGKCAGREQDTFDARSIHDTEIPKSDLIMIFETERLLVRQLQEADFEPFHEMQSDELVMRYTTGDALDEATNRQQLKMCMDAYSLPGNRFRVWAIIRKSDSTFLGTCALTPHDGEPEVGYRFLRKHFGQGFGQEICDALIDHALNIMQVKSLVAFVDVRNTGSVRILDRCRLTFVGERPDQNGDTERCYRYIEGSDGSP